MLFWVDIETTGLDPQVHSVIEVAVILTTSTLKKLGQFTWMEPYQEPVIWSKQAEAMHRYSGLLEKFMESKSKGLLTDKIDKFLEKHKAVKPVMAGNSVHFDKKFLERFNPKFFDDKFHYRLLDISSISRFMTDLGFEKPPVDQPTHRAMDDIKRSLKIYKHWRKSLQNVKNR